MSHHPHGLTCGLSLVQSQADMETRVSGIVWDRVRKNDPEAEGALERLRGVLQGTRPKEVEHIAQALDLFDFSAAAQTLTTLAETEGIPLPSVT